MSPTVEDAAAEANRLYWESELSVAEIAQQLELSRRALYDAVQPLPAGRSCVDCGGPLTYENRSARSADNALCEACADEDTPIEEAQPSAQAEPAGDEMEDQPMRIAGAALAGAALGALVTLVLVQRR